MDRFRPPPVSAVEPALCKRSDGCGVRLDRAAAAAGETGWAALDHELESYDPVAGKLLAWIRLPSWALAGQQQLFVYYGNPSTTGSEANPAGVWQGYLARWRLPDGSDATASDRDLTAFNVQPGELLGSAASLDGSGRLTLADASWLDGLSTLTVQALVKPDASMIGNSARILAQGDDPTGEASLSLGYLAETGDGVTNVVYAAFGGTGGEAVTFSRADQQTNERQLIHAEWQSSEAPRLYLNGAAALPSSSQAGSGPPQVDGGPLEIGAGWTGLIDEVRLADRALPAAWIATEARNMLTPELSHGLGEEETAATLDSSRKLEQPLPRRRNDHLLTDRCPGAPQGSSGGDRGRQPGRDRPDLRGGGRRALCFQRLLRGAR